MASINQMGGIPAINNIPQGYAPYYNTPNYYNIPNYSPAPNNGYIQRSPYENYLNGKGNPIEEANNGFFGNIQGPFAANEELFDKIQENCINTISYISKIGIHYEGSYDLDI